MSGPQTVGPDLSLDEGSDWVPARRRRLSEEVVSRVREAILEGRLRPGQRIVETELAERLRVSKSPVREAMKELEREGLVSIHPHQGAFVRNMDVKDIREIRTIRSALEGLAVTLGMERAADEWLDALDRQVALMREATDKAELNDLHLGFHELLVAGADNERLSEILGSLWTQVRTFLAFIDLLYGDAAAIADDHRALMEVIRGGDPVRAREVAEQHVSVAGAELERIWLAHQAETAATGDGAADEGLGVPGEPRRARTGTGSSSARSGPVTRNPWRRGRPLISAHKGHAAGYPEQTMEALEGGLRLGADLIEVDVRRTRDGHLVLLHDPTVDRTTNGSGPVDRLTLREIQRLDAGGWFGPQFAGLTVPTAAAALDLAIERQRTVVFDIKGPSGEDAAEEDDLQLEVAQDVARLIERRGGLGHAVIASFNHRSLRAAKAVLPAVAVAPWMPEDRPADPSENVAATRELGAQVMIHTHTLLVDALMEAARRADIAIWAWTTTDQPSLDACLAFRPDALDGGDVVAMTAAVARAELSGGRR